MPSELLLRGRRPAAIRNATRGVSGNDAELPFEYRYGVCQAFPPIDNVAAAADHIIAAPVTAISEFVDGKSGAAAGIAIDGKSGHPPALIYRIILPFPVNDTTAIEGQELVEFVSCEIYGGDVFTPKFA
jgi:hypothetical protein